jgi:CRISPR-associated protein Cas2
MSLHDPVRWIVCYDICDRRRGASVHRWMKKQGVPLQYSVFMVEASAARIHQLMQELEELIAVHSDDVRAYRWPEHAEVHQLGRSLLPDGVLLDTPPPPKARPIRRRAGEPA